ncbi:MAG: hypothetical protein AAF501_09385 [Pseudomonadota bacterium]
MTETVVRQRDDGLAAMLRYGLVSAVIGVAGLLVFVFFTLGVEQARSGFLALAVGVIIQWIVWLLVFLPARRSFREQAAFGLSNEERQRAILAAAFGEAGWIILFVASLFAALVSGGAEQLGIVQEVFVAAAVAAIMLPGSVVLLTVVMTVRGVRDA